MRFKSNLFRYEVAILLSNELTNRGCLPLRLTSPYSFIHPSPPLKISILHFVWSKSIQLHLSFPPLLTTLPGVILLSCLTGLDLELLSSNFLVDCSFVFYGLIHHIVQVSSLLEVILGAFWCQGPVWYCFSVLVLKTCFSETLLWNRYRRNILFFVLKK